MNVPHICAVFLLVGCARLHAYGDLRDRKRFNDMKRLAVFFLTVAAAAGCYTGEFYPDSPDGGDYGRAEAADASYSPGSNGGQGGGQAGVVTAGEWNDLDNWPFWGKLMNTKGDEQTVGFADVPAYWRFWTDRRVAVLVKDGQGVPKPGVKVELFSGSDNVWTSVTDVFGKADCWIGLYDDKYQAGSLSLKVDGKDMPEAPAVTSWTDEAVALNECTVDDVAVPQPKADILFIVDATGSMSDEIDFLKADLLDILKKVQNSGSALAIRTGALFYRDEGDDYLIRTSAFTTDFGKTIDFVKKQKAEGGGDFPEAVHTALEVSLQGFDWDSSARTRIAFMLLDAPPHQDHQGVIESLQKSIKLYASKGIKLIPVASSGVDKPTEFCLRLFAIATGGTYVFLTNDSGVGNDHIQATVGPYEVEKLNDLMVRLIQKYLG